MKADTTATANTCRKFMTKLKPEFYTRDTLTVAKELLGKYIVRELDGHRLSVMITETEAYIGSVDKACHAYNYKRTPRTSTLFNKGGCSYVYLIYGMYNCLNVVTEAEGEPCAVLIRGGEPIMDIEYMSNIRYGKAYHELTRYQLNNFCNGPGKLCKALAIDKSLNALPLDRPPLYITEGKKIHSFNTGKRINIDYAEEAADFPWRFYI